MIKVITNNDNKIIIVDPKIEVDIIIRIIQDANKLADNLLDNVNILIIFDMRSIIYIRLDNNE